MINNYGDFVNKFNDLRNDENELCIRYTKEKNKNTIHNNIKIYQKEVDGHAKAGYC